jgi:hypothetical protein
MHTLKPPGCALACDGARDVLRPLPRRYYLNNQDAYRLKLLLPLTDAQVARLAAQQAEDEQQAAMAELQPLPGHSQLVEASV